MSTTSICKPILSFLASIIFMMGCAGIEYTMKGGKVPGTTFSIENFENAAPLGNPNLNIMVQDVLRERLLRETGLKYKPSDGDAHFTGTITNYTITPVLGTGESTANLNRLTISLAVTYSNKVDDKNDFSRTFTDFDDFESSEDISAKEEELIKTIGDKLVTQIFNEVLVDW